MHTHILFSRHKSNNTQSRIPIMMYTMSFIIKHTTIRIRVGAKYTKYLPDNIKNPKKKIMGTMSIAKPNNKPFSEINPW